jgi:hypothetical protein
MDVVKVLGSERCYLMTDGSKVPFSDRDKIFGNRGAVAEANKIIIAHPAVYGADNKPIKKKRIKRTK